MPPSSSPRRLLVADVEALADQLGAVLVGRRATKTSGRSASTSQPSQLPNTGRNAFDSEPGTWPAPNAANGRSVDDERTGGDVPLDRLDVEAVEAGQPCRSGVGPSRFSSGRRAK